MIPQGEGERTIIQRVLKLRKQMKLDNELSTADPRNSGFFPTETEVRKHSTNHLYSHKRWERGPDWGQDG